LIGGWRKTADKAAAATIHYAKSAVLLGICERTPLLDGAARVGGILNAPPERSIQIRRERAPAEFYAWDIAKFNADVLRG
jgi:hypothetical protein